jgi:hypothetical protein
MNKHKPLADYIVESAQRTIMLGFAVVFILLALADAWFFAENLKVKHQNIYSSLLKVSQQYYYSGDIVSMRNFLNTMANLYSFGGTFWFFSRE